MAELELELELADKFESRESMSHSLPSHIAASRREDIHDDEDAKGYSIGVDESSHRIVELETELRSLRVKAASEKSLIDNLEEEIMYQEKLNSQQFEEIERLKKQIQFQSATQSTIRANENDSLTSPDLSSHPLLTDDHATNSLLHSFQSQIGSLQSSLNEIERSYQIECDTNRTLEADLNATEQLLNESQTENVALKTQLLEIEKESTLVHGELRSKEELTRSLEKKVEELMNSPHVAEPIVIAISISISPESSPSLSLSPLPSLSSASMCENTLRDDESSIDSSQQVLQSPYQFHQTGDKIKELGQQLLRAEAELSQQSVDHAIELKTKNQKLSQVNQRLTESASTIAHLTNRVGALESQLAAQESDSVTQLADLKLSMGKSEQARVDHLAKSTEQQLNAIKLKHKEEIEKLKQEHEANVARIIEQHSSSFETVGIELTTLRQANLDLESQLSDLQAQLQSLTNDRMIASGGDSDDIGLLDSSILTASSTTSFLLGTCDDSITTTLTELHEQELANLQGQIEELEIQQRRDSTTTNTDHTALINCSSPRDALNHLSAVHEPFPSTERMTRLEKELQSTKIILSAQIEQHIEDEALIHSLQSKLHHLDSSLTLAQSRESNLTHQYSLLQSVRDDLASQNLNLTAEVARFTRYVTELETSLKASQRECQTLKEMKKLLELEAQHQLANGLIDNPTQEELKEAQLRCEVLEQQLEISQSQIDSLEVEVDALKAQLLSKDLLYQQLRQSNAGSTNITTSPILTSSRPNMIDRLILPQPDALACANTANMTVSASLLDSSPSTPPRIERSQSQIGDGSLANTPKGTARASPSIMSPPITPTHAPIESNEFSIGTSTQSNSSPSHSHSHSHSHLHSSSSHRRPNSLLRPPTFRSSNTAITLTTPTLSGDIHSPTVSSPITPKLQSQSATKTRSKLTSPKINATPTK